MKRRWILIGVVLGVLFHEAAMGQIVTVDSPGNVGVTTSLAVVNGNPAISYHDEGNYGLKYARALDADGSTWGIPLTVDDPGPAWIVGVYTSLAVVNGNPAISYYDHSNGVLKYVRASDANGSTWGTPITVDSAGIVGWYTSLTVVNGRPAISYYDSFWSNGDLKYVRATDADGSTWGTPVTVDSTGDVGLYTSLTVVNGNPAISYYDDTNGDLKYVRADDMNGDAWGTPATADSTGDVGMYTSLAVVNGNPAISYFDDTNNNLKYVRAADIDGSTWGTPATLDNGMYVGRFTSLAVINGNPAISYTDIGNAYLKYIEATDANGSGWRAPITADGTGNGGWYTSLAEVNGTPAVSYYDVMNGDLKYWRYEEPPVIPALNEWGMIIFALLACGIAIGVRRSYRTGSGFNR